MGCPDFFGGMGLDGGAGSVDPPARSDAQKALTRLRPCAACTSRAKAGPRSACFWPSELSAVNTRQLSVNAAVEASGIGLGLNVGAAPPPVEGWRTAGGVGRAVTATAPKVNARDS